ncbi:hypothetical protein AgCh_034449 [Apium graveolens]
MNHPGSLPQELLPVPVFNGPAFNAYPFQAMNGFTDQQLLTALRQFVQDELPAEFQIIAVEDFTKFDIDQLRGHYGVQQGAFLPLYYWHHWVCQPKKRDKDMVQVVGVPPVGQPPVSLAVWTRYGRAAKIKIGQVSQGTKARYCLHTSHGEGTPKPTRYFLDVYQLPQHAYNDPVVETKAPL